MKVLQPQPEDGFDRFWQRYPVKRAKGDARRAWDRLNPDVSLTHKILRAIDEQVRCRQWREGYIPYPATWLRGERWDDELTDADYYQAKL